MLQYKTVAGPTVVTTSSNDFTYATNTYAKIINDQAQKGWKYHSMNTITVEKPMGCLALFLPPQRTLVNMLIFYRESEEKVATNVNSTNSKPATPVSSARYSGQQRTAGTWACKNCGTENKVEYGMCKKCGCYRSSK